MFTSNQSGDFLHVIQEPATSLKEGPNLWTVLSRGEPHSGV